VSGVLSSALKSVELPLDALRGVVKGRRARCPFLLYYRHSGTGRHRQPVEVPFQLPIDGAATVDFDTQYPCLYQACILMIDRCGLSRTAGCNVVLVCC